MFEWMFNSAVRVAEMLDIWAYFIVCVVAAANCVVIGLLLLIAIVHTSVALLSSGGKKVS